VSSGRAVVITSDAVTPLAEGAVESGFLYRASHPAMRESALLDTLDQTITMCTLPTLDPLLHGAERAIRIAQPALERAGAALGAGAASSRVKFFLCLDELRGIPGLEAESELRRIAGTLQQQARRAFNERVTFESLADGAGAAGRLLEAALDQLNAGMIDVAFVGGVHSDYSPAIVQHLEREHRLFSSERLDALIPGECAAFVGLATENTAHRLALPVLARVQALATAWDRARPDNDESAYEAAGFTMAFRSAIERLDLEREKVGWILSDASFEMREIYEWQAATVRTQRLFTDPQFYDFPAHRLGHLGAAALPLMLSLAAVAWHHGYAPHERAVLMAGSDAGERTVLIASRGVEA
jgi:3-oxoacyl-[acyl-carrier-protein] synthase I